MIQITGNHTLSSSQCGKRRNLALPPFDKSAVYEFETEEDLLVFLLKR